MNTQALTISRQYRFTLLWISLLFTLSLVLIMSLIWGAAKAVDTSDLHYTQQMINQSVQAERQRLINQLKDYAIWDDAYSQWHNNAIADPKWLKSNFGDSLYTNLGIEWVMVKDKSGQVIYSNTPGRKPSSPTLLAQLVDASLTTPDMTTQIISADGNLWILASHEVMPDNRDIAPGDGKRYFIFAQPITTSLLPQLKLHTDIGDIHFTRQLNPDMSQLSINDQQGNPIGYLSWSPRNPGSQLLKELLPGVFLLLAILAAATLLLIRRLVHQGRKSLQKIEALANTRSALSKQQDSMLRLRQRFQKQPQQQETFLTELLHESRQLIQHDIAAIWLLDDSGESITCKASNSTMKGKHLPITALDECVHKLQQKPVLTVRRKDLTPGVTDISRFYRTLLSYMRDYKIESAAMTGIYLGGELRGILTFGSLQAKIWNAAERNACSTLAGVIAQFAETFRRQAAEQDLYQKLHFDPITELPRMAYVQQHFSEMFHQNTGYLAIFRAQGLHIVNELHGLDAGNELFRNLCRFMGQELSLSHRENLLVRLPANRIGLFLHADQHYANDRIHQLIARVASTSWSVRGRAFSLQLQAGLAGYPDDGQEIEILQHRAKLALQHVRSTPDEKLAFYSHDVHTGLRQRNDTIREIQRALDNEEFELYFQPQYDPKGHIGGAEVLVRWQHPSKGLLSPFHFISLAEETGLIVPLGSWILQQACRRLEQVPISLSVNISVLQLQQDEFVDEVRALLNHYRIDPGQLILEIVESLLVEPEVKDKLTQLRELGVQISLDDFGTGYSSLSYLQELHLDELKVDQSFIQTLTHQDDAPLVRTIIAMAHTLNMRVVVEGVETQEQLAFVQQHKAELTQGYLLAKPMPWDHFTARMNLPMLSVPDAD